MKRTAVVAVVFVGAVTLAGCASAPAARPSAPASIPAYSNTISPAEYLTLMHAIPDFSNTDDAALVRVGESTCAVMRKDGWQTAIRAFSASGHDLNQSYAAVQYAVTAYCPDLLSAIPPQ